ncbi:hypothetical protein L1D33_23810 [Vibrio chagasii]|uniref:hypothetical protein n=1 Tax=Vibrio chagasii TaxID=170679 RepID=UPI001EFD0538|nr:hypothetical protein [Vibrio chagasii]MCG9676534.1 hypothetical protein [Vibrio chagasii]
MNRSLRKGSTRVYFQHRNTGHNIGVKLVESELDNDLAILRFTLSPVSGDQKHDENYLHDEILESVSISDDRVIDGFRRHIGTSSIKVTSYKLELLSRGKKLEFNVMLNLDRQGDLSTLCLTVENG